MSIISNVMLTVTEAFKSAYPDAAMGILVMREVANPAHHPELEARKAALEDELRARFARHDRAALSALASIQPYVAYYGRFKKSYHVLLQLESVALKRRSLPRVAALVEAMFMAELKNQLLTAGHDGDTRRVLFAVYAPPGIEHATVHQHLEDIQANVRVIALGAAVELLKVYVAE